MSNILLIALGGALGAIARYAINHVTTERFEPEYIGTLVANISGAFLLGLLIGFLSTHPDWPTGIRLFLAVGFLASYTTFSTLSVATVQSLELGDLTGAMINLGVSVILGISAAAAGIMIGRAV